VLACLTGVSTASANSVECWGRAAPTSTAQTELTYAFQCSEPLKGFSIVSNLEVGEFSTTADVLDPTTREPISGQTFGCEGPIPGDGFGCSGTSQDPNVVTGTFGIDSPRCVKRRNKLRVWVVAIDLAGTASGPRGLSVPPRCAKVAKHTSKRG
jgi:hypothetical protein